MIFRAIRIIAFLIFFCPIILLGQENQKAIKKAEREFQLGHYAKAIPLYKDALAVRTNSGWLRKLADCYRLTNQIDKASETYEALLFTSKKIKPREYLKYSEVLINQGNYNLAKEMLTIYVSKESDDLNAKTLLSNIDKIKLIPSLYPNIELLPFNQNTDADDHGAVFLDDGIVFVSDRDRNMTLFKEHNETTGREYLSLYFAQKTNQLEYSKPVHLPRKINKLNKNTGPASFTSDGKTMVFSQNNSIENKKGIHTLQLYTAKREGGNWKNINKISFCNENLNYMHPAISPDGKTLFFVSDKGRGEGGTDIYISKKVGKKWSRPESLGPNVNSEANEGFPFMNNDGKLYFCSKGHLGFGGYDIFYSQQDEYENWSKAINLGQPINSSRDDISFCLNSEGNFGLFTSSRQKGDDDIYLFRFKENNMVVSLEIKDEENGIGVSDTTVKIIASDQDQDTSSVILGSDKKEVILDKDKSYDIIIMKKGFEQFSKKLNPSEIQATFLKLDAELKKEEIKL